MPGLFLPGSSSDGVAYWGSLWTSPGEGPRSTSARCRYSLACIGLIGRRPASGGSRRGGSSRLASLVPGHDAALVARSATGWSRASRAWAGSAARRGTPRSRGLGLAALLAAWARSVDLREAVSLGDVFGPRGRARLVRWWAAGSRESQVSSGLRRGNLGAPLPGSAVVLWIVAAVLVAASAAGSSLGRSGLSRSRRSNWASSSTWARCVGVGRSQSSRRARSSEGWPRRATSGLVAGQLEDLPVRSGLTPAYPYLGIPPPPPNYLLEASKSVRSSQDAGSDGLAAPPVRRDAWSLARTRLHRRRKDTVWIGQPMLRLDRLLRGAKNDTSRAPPGRLSDIDPSGHPHGRAALFSKHPIGTISTGASRERKIVTRHGTCAERPRRKRAQSAPAWLAFNPGTE